MTMRKSALASLSLLSLLFVAQAPAANAWTRSVTAVGPRGGVYHATGSGSCAGGSCSSSRVATGPRGGTVTRSRSTSCADGTCNHSATVTGPNGGTVSRSTTVSRD
jgi:hypothetical protein